MYIELYQSIILPVESVINREITLMDITIQCLLSSSQDPSKCLFSAYKAQRAYKMYNHF